MYCSKCGKETQEGIIFCSSCGTKISSTSDENIQTMSEKSEAKNIIKCANCEYVGKGESARRMISQICAWLCIIFSPLITILYFVATDKYRCPKCHSNFVGIKNKRGIYVSKKKSLAIIIFVVLMGIATIGLLSTLAVVSLNNARMKSRDAKRISDIKQIQTALELYYWDTDAYPKGVTMVLGGDEAKVLISSGFNFSTYGNEGVVYFGSVPINPTPGGIDYIYTAYNEDGLLCEDALTICSYYIIEFETEDVTGDFQAGMHFATPQGIDDLDSELFVQ